MEDTMNEDFDGSELRELLTPAVADRGKTSAPADAIVAAGRRRVAGRRVAVAGGALAIVAAVPLAASAIAAGPGKAGNETVATAAAAPPSTRSHASAQTGNTNTPNPNPPNSNPNQTSASGGGLPASPVVLASGTVDGKHWSVSGVGSGGNNALTAKDRCLNLLVSEDGRLVDPALGDHLLYCQPGETQGYMLEQMGYDIRGGKGSLEIGLVCADVVKLVAHLGGVPDPVTITTVPAPGNVAARIYVVATPGNDGARSDFDAYNAAGVKIGSFNNHTPAGQQ